MLYITVGKLFSLQFLFLLMYEYDMYLHYYVQRTTVERASCLFTNPCLIFFDDVDWCFNSRKDLELVTDLMMCIQLKINVQLHYICWKKKYYIIML